MRARAVSPLRVLHRVLRRPGRLPAAADAATAPRAVAARRTLDRLLLVAIGASLLAAVLERHARERLGVDPIPSLPVDLAADPPERLRLLPGLGPTRLAALLAERARAGAPAGWSELERVRGIGAKTLEGWRAAGAVLGGSRAGNAAEPHAR